MISMNNIIKNMYLILSYLISKDILPKYPSSFLFKQDTHNRAFFVRSNSENSWQRLKGCHTACTAGQTDRQRRSSD